MNENNGTPRGCLSIVCINDCVVVNNYNGNLPFVIMLPVHNNRNFETVTIAVR